MKSINLIVVSCAVALAACGGREWRPAKNNKPVDNINVKAERGFEGSGYNPQDPASLALLNSVGGASLKDYEGAEGKQTEGFVTVSVVLKNSCEQFNQLMPVDTGVSNGVEAEVSNSNLSNETENHGWFETRCIGENKSCNQVAVLFTHSHEGKRAQTVITFAKNQYGKYQVIPAQNSGVVVGDFDEFLSQRNSKCEVQPKDDTILREQD